MIIGLSTRWPFVRLRRCSLARLERRVARIEKQRRRARKRAERLQAGKAQARQALARARAGVEARSAALAARTRERDAERAALADARQQRSNLKATLRDCRSLAKVYSQQREALARAVRRQAAGAPAPPDFPLLEGEVAGLRFTMPDRGHDGGLERQLRRGSTRWSDLQLREALAGGGGYLDIGANIGLTSLPHAVAGRFSPIVAVEPEARNFACLAHNCRVNGLEQAVVPRRCALGAAPGEASLTVETGAGLHHLGVETGVASQQVPLLTVDALLAELGIDPERIALVKCDTQGGEAAVLAGAAGLLARRRALWCLEVWPQGLTRAGADPEALFALVEGAFSRLVDCGRQPYRLEPISAFRALFERLAEADGFTDAMLLP